MFHFRLKTEIKNNQLRDTVLLLSKKKKRRKEGDIKISTTTTTKGGKKESTNTFCFMKVSVLNRCHYRYMHVPEDNVPVINVTEWKYGFLN